MLRLPLAKLIALLAPLLLIGFAVGAVRAAAQRSGGTPTGRRALQAAWVLLLLVGAPLWLVLAAVMGIW